jgi:hypothetical protein
MRANRNAHLRGGRDLIAFWAALGMARFLLIRSEGHCAEDRVLFLASRRIEIGFGERPNDGAASH